ncbi:EthD domain-containing protein [Pseudonocardia spinosispora]|uniref:EthD domain-containing protein n=1 Tax=Pseudonocardia spinosispora TaxID=103441 RepID=UPI0003FC4E4D|nr:EthD domain-containing protein [Pseudonocardia spinosispora]
MIKLVYILRARADVDIAEFRRYWLEDHAPKVRGVAEAIGAVRYVQSHTLDTPLNQALVEGRSMTEGFEGITEVWFDDLDTLTARAASAEGAEAMSMLQRDESTFIDLARSTIFLTEEHEIFDLT